MQDSVNPVLIKISGVLKRKKLLLCVAALVAAALVGFYALGGAKKAESNYITDTVKKGAVTNTIPATGMIEPVNTVSLNFKNAEIIKKIYVKVGDRVTAGQLLAEQESDNLELQLSQSAAILKGAVAKLELLKNGSTAEDIAQAEVSLSMARSAYDLARTNLERNQMLFDGGAVSQSDLDTAKNEYAGAEGKLKQAEVSLQSLRNGNRQEDIDVQAAQVENSSAQLQIAQKDLAGTRMVSPMGGIISEVNGGEGQRATANNNSTSGSGAGFVVVISEALQVKAQVNEADIGKLEVGQMAELTVNSFPNKTFTGKVSSISPQASTVSNVQVYDTIIQLDENRQGLKAGMPANINIIITKSDNALTVAKGAVTYAAGYLNKTGQGVSVRPASIDGGNSGSAGGPKSSGGGTAAPGPAKVKANVLILDQSGKPVPRQVVLGLSDQKNYEVLEGLTEGDMVVVGAGGATGTGDTSSRSSNTGAGGMPFIRGGGTPPR